MSLTSMPGFFSSGRMTACLNILGKEPDDRETLNSYTISKLVHFLRHSVLQLVEHVMMSSNQHSSLCYSTKQKHDMHNKGHGKDKKGDNFLNKRSGTQFYDWKPMQSIIHIIHKNFKEDHINLSRLTGFPGGFLNSRRSPGFPGFLDILSILFLKTH